MDEKEGSPMESSMESRTESRTHLLGAGNDAQIIFRMSLPSIASLVAIGIFYLVDAAFIGRLGTRQLSAISVSFPVFAVIAGIGQALGVGAASWISRHLGENRREAADEVASTTFFSVVILGIVVAASILGFLEPLLKSLGASDAVLPYAKRYTQILVLANVITMLNIAMGNIVRAEGNAPRSMAAVILSSGLNIALDPIFIYAAGMGLSGAAVGTVVSQAASFAFLSITFIQNKNHCKINIRLWKRGLGRLPGIIRVGAATLFLQLLGGVALAVTNAAAKRFGDAAVASVGLTLRILSLGMYPVYGFSIGFQPVAGYSFGAKNIDRVLGVLKTTVIWTSVFACAFSVLTVSSIGIVLPVMSKDPEVIEIGTRMIRIVTAFFPLFSFQIVIAIFLQAIGRAFLAALIIISRQAIFFLPAIFILPRLLDLQGVIFSQPLSDILTFAVAALSGISATRSLYRDRRLKPKC